MAIAGFGLGCEAGRPLSLGMLRGQGDAAQARGEHSEALANYALYLERRPGAAEVRYRQGRSFMATGDVLAARESFTIASDLEPDNPIYLDALIDAMLAAGERDAAFAMLERRAEELGGPGAYLTLGRALARAGLPDDAERAFLIASELADNESVAAHWQLADFYREIGDRESELRRLRVLLYLDPTDEHVSARIRDLGEIPGPSFALPPDSIALGD